ncbi:MAG TPA: hypothetical protein DIU01_06295 [Flavobacterium sp.]|nr:hypothetical protein [Flavobacterium sp.]
MDLLLLAIIGILLFISPFTLLIGLYKVLFQKEDKAFGIQLLIYSSIVLVIGLGTCFSINGIT